MGIKGFFKKGKAEVSEQPTPSPTPIVRPSFAGVTFPSATSFATQDSKTCGVAWDVKRDVMCEYIFKQQLQNQWINNRGADNQGVLIRRKIGSYSAAPLELEDSQFAAACTELNLQVIDPLHVSFSPPFC